MAKEGMQKSKRPSVPIAADFGPIRNRTSKSSGADDPGSKNSTSNPNPNPNPNLNMESVDWVLYSQEERLENVIRKKLDHFYGQALSRLVYMGYDEDAALQGLLERGYCFGVAECLTNIVQNSLEFLTGKRVESEQDRPQPFQNLELLLDFNLHFLLYILKKYSPNMNRISLLRCILITDLNLNRAIFMITPLGMKDMFSDSNLDDDDVDDGEKDVFLALEIKEILDKLNILDESITEDMKDKMIADLQKPIDDLKPQLKKRMRWASKKVVETRRKQPCMEICLKVELRVLEYSLEIMLRNRVSEITSAKNGFHNAEETIARLKMVKEEIKAEISASKLIESETRQKCLEVSKKGGRGKNWEKQKVKMEEEMEMEKKKISKWKQELVENEAAIIQAQVKLGEVAKAKQRIIELICLENQLASRKWNIWRHKVDALKIHTNGEIGFLIEQIDRVQKLLIDALSFDLRTENASLQLRS